MIQPPSPPQKATEYLSRLAQYYRELIEYHQQAEIAAAQQLGHVEALLGNEPGLPTQQVRSRGASAIASWLVDESAKQTTIATDSTNEQLEHQQGSFSSDTGEENSSDSSEVVGDEDGDDEDDAEEFSLPSLEQLLELFEAKRGKMLHIDYIIYHFYETIEVPQQQKIVQKLTERLKLGSLKHLWSQVPDATDGWTLTLLDLAELPRPNQENPLFPEIKSEVLPTRKVAALLSIKKEKIYELKKLYSADFLKGVDYFLNDQGHYLWTKRGVDKLKTYQKKVDRPPREKQQDTQGQQPISQTLSDEHYKNYWKQVAQKVEGYGPNS